MQLFPTNRVYDFMRIRHVTFAISAVSFVVSLILLFVWPKPIYGTDFRGGTELELAFKGPVEAQTLRSTVEALGFSGPSVIKVEDAKSKYHFIIRVQEVSALNEEQVHAVEKALCLGDNSSCPVAERSKEVKVSPGGDKITARFAELPNLVKVKERVSAVNGLKLRSMPDNPQVVNAKENRVEIHLMSKGDQLMDGLKQKLGSAAPDSPLRIEWIGPKAGAQLRDAALKAIAMSLLFIMGYIALRFDARFSPGAVIALGHDAIVVLGILTILGQEITLTTVAAVLTVIGYSVNDTVIVYDRVRENLGRMRGVPFERLINVSISEMLGRTILTSVTTLLSLSAFFLWGTGELKAFALTLVIGIILGTYSSVYVALPLTWLLDTMIFQRIVSKKVAA